jgi:hypothetical protein
MGTRKTKLRWSWPLISLEWIPEILSSFDNLIEPSWIGLQRQLTVHVASKKFSNRIFDQLQQLLIDMHLVEEKGKFIQATVNSNPTSIRKHLTDLLNESSEPWANFFSEVSQKKYELIYSQIKDNPPLAYPDIAFYPVFKQWSSFFQYIGYGYLTDKEHFIPESLITDEMVQNEKFIEKCLKAIGDPRHLTGNDSLHTEREFLSWTNGEDYLPITVDQELKPRIPFELIHKRWQENKTEKSGLLVALTESTESWYQMIETQLSDYAFSNLVSVIYTCKLILDYFLFGKLVSDNDFIDKEKIYSIQKRWHSVNHFKLPNNLWKILPNLYKDITRLYWGITQYRNSLQRPIFNEKLYDDSIFKTKLELTSKIPIRCFRSRRSLQAIFQSFSTIYISLSRLIDNQINHYYQNQTQNRLNDINNYLPANPLKTKELIENLIEFIELNSEEKTYLQNHIKLDFQFDYPEEIILQTCFWVHKYYDLLEMPQISIINTLKTQLDMIQKKYIKDINYYEKDQNEWDISCNYLKRITSNFKLVCE